MAIVMVALGWALADLATGIYHLAVDNGVGLRSQVDDFRHHHDHPGELRFWSAHTLAPASSVVFVLPLVLVDRWLWAATSVGLIVSQAAHVAAHQRRPCLMVRVLQRAGIILPPAKHARHHADTSRCFPILCGWTAGPLDVLIRVASGPAAVVDQFVRWLDNPPGSTKMAIAAIPLGAAIAWWLILSVRAVFELLG